ncbi:MAG: VWA domain-containing protein [Pyrinomonadaceae bacterium]
MSLFLLVNFAEAQTPTEDAPIKVDTVLVTLPLTVSDKLGHNVPGLKKEDFVIYQDGSEQDIELFLNDEAPMNVAILLDTSFSTKKVLGKIQKAAREFVKVLRPEDRGVIVSFDDRTQFLSDFTSDRKKLSSAIDNARIAEKAGSDMPNAVSQVINKYFASFKGRKAVIVLTDGMVIGRDISAQQTLEALQQSDVIFYPIIFKSNFYSQSISNGRKSLPLQILDFLAGETAGRVYEKDAGDLKEAFEGISEELKKQYLLGFYPGSQNGTSLGHIKVAVAHQDYTIGLKKRRF